MHWRVKAAVQNLVARLPERHAHGVYFWMQRQFGALRSADPLPHLRRAVRLVELVREAGGDVDGATLLEVGSGRTLNIPIGLWLCGASRVVTVDANRYHRPELTLETVTWLSRSRDRVESLLDDAGVPAARVRERLDALAGASTLGAVQGCTGISYVAPCDARALPLIPGSVDIHFSTNVLEHVPADVILGILGEAARVLKPGGLLAHRVDLSDHFSHGDPRISSINFLRFSESEWSRIAGNRFMYQNRLRADDYERLLTRAGIQPRVQHEHVDAVALTRLRHGFPLAEPFASRAPDVLAVTLMEFVGGVAA